MLPQTPGLPGRGHGRRKLPAPPISDDLALRLLKYHRQEFRDYAVRTGNTALLAKIDGYEEIIRTAAGDVFVSDSSSTSSGSASGSSGQFSDSSQDPDAPSTSSN